MACIPIADDAQASLLSVAIDTFKVEVYNRLVGVRSALEVEQGTILAM